MNRRKVHELNGKWVRLRPIPRRFTTAGAELDESDHPWLVTEASRNGVTIQDARRGGHILALAPDQIREFRTDPSENSFGFLILNGQVWVRGRDAGVEPLIYRTPQITT